MTIAAKISSAELDRQVRAGYADQFFEVSLLNAPGVVYEPATSDDAIFAATELAPGFGGYYRQVLYFSDSDVLAYADDGITLSTKAAIFTHNGNNSEALSFTHVVLQRGSGNVLALGAVQSNPTTGTVDGVYEDVPISSASGFGATCQLTVSGSVHTVALIESGYGYTSGQAVSITGQTLQLIGANTTASDPVNFSIFEATTGDGNFVSVARPDSPVLLQGGNQAVFYYNLKQFGFHNVSS